ncbi:hypothetical protein BO226_24630 (plasmid) [Rhodococcus sp. 2G]|uniref:class I SAM-dependent methyltransferase n=1 Tax=Rhodococcus sp. 2G TaxID=1570939 RepID=UPI000903B0AB|nr:class I SAM-dependent methyltransferase [Rhodococcus sp. 2G]APE12553.1 hypothetical protein BO226_24630 [Rhodococcus sp. 2G]
MISNHFYDALAPHYQSASGVSPQFNARVDAHVAQKVSRASSWLDIGTGDGHRAMRILAASTAQPTRLLACDSSAQMTAIAERTCTGFAVQNWNPAETEPPATFNNVALISLLGNVFGHVLTPSDRSIAMRRVAAVLSPGGQLVLDFNNRRNMRQYGWTNVTRRALRYAAGGDDGTFVARKNIDGTEISTGVYLGTVKEYRDLLSATGLDVTETLFIDYRTGADAGPLTGQALLVATKPQGATTA